jgi:hypothetical protein
MSTTSSFDLWMSKGVLNIFSLIVNIFLNQDWMSKHVNFGLFEAYETVGHALTKKLQKAFGVVQLDEKINCLC